MQENKMLQTLTKNYYNTVLSQCFSPCGNYLIAGDIYGCISVFHLSKTVKPDNPVTKNELQPKNKFTIKKNIQINSLLSTPSFLLVGLVNEIHGYAWKTVKSSKTPSPSWTIEIPASKDSYDKVDINCMVWNEDMGVLYVGCGNNEVYVFNLETRKNLNELKDHTDYIHCLCHWENELVTSGEDGKVILWDLRTHKLASKLEPCLNDNIARPNLGKWIGAVDMKGELLVCGGGPRLSMWNSRFLRSGTVCPIVDEGVHVISLEEHKLFTGGKSKYFYQMDINGKIVTEIPTSAGITYSAIYQEKPFPVLCIAGSSNKIDVSNSFMYADIQLTV